MDEYYAGGSERTPVRTMAKSVVASAASTGSSSGGSRVATAPEQMPRMPHMRGLETSTLDGTYEGMLVTYDWSGKIVLKETSLSINITTDKQNVLAEWREEGTDTITVKGLWQDTELTFTDAQQGRRGHYDAKGKVAWNFTDAQLQLLQDDSSSYLVGNLQMFSPQTLEPNQPMYINLKKTSQAVTSVTTRKGFYVYPNPFSDGLNISFYQQKDAEVTVTINKTSGERVYSASLGKYAQGQQDSPYP